MRQSVRERRFAVQDDTHEDDGALPGANREPGFRSGSRAHRLQHSFELRSVEGGSGRGGWCIGVLHVDPVQEYGGGAKVCEVHLVKQIDRRSVGKSRGVDGNTHLELQGKRSGLRCGFGAG